SPLSYRKAEKEKLARHNEHATGLQSPITLPRADRRLKARGVLVVPGEFFFFGLPEGEGGDHASSCLRVTYTMPEEVVREGIRVIAEEVKKAFAEE
ncbi:MAG: hypothetical protein ACQKBY_10525, partial [Verrucomicrobiales bacterium]